MDKYLKFKEQIKEAADKFEKINKNETIRIISHLDADGICASSILIKALNIDNRKYSISIAQHLTRKALETISKEKYNYFVFTDLGSGQLKNINELFKGKNVFVLDHHEPQKAEEAENVCHVNPHSFGIDGSREISGAGVVYFFAKNLNEKNNELAHIAVVAAIGDIQEHNGFEKLNNEILEDAVKEKKIEVKRGLKFFGIQTRPLHKILEYSTDPYIPGVSGSESGAVQFLKQLKIEPKTNNAWKRISNLNDDEMKRLVTGIIMKRLGEDKPEDVLGNIYVLKDEEEDSPLRDAKEFSTLLNSCGRLNKASLGIGACLGDKKIKKKAIENSIEYKREIIKAIEWFNEHKNNKSKNIIREKGFIIINGEDKITHTIIGTLASILSRSNELEKGTFVLSFARADEEFLKVSLRMAGTKKGVDLIKVIKDIAGGIEGSEAGGHVNAAGAIIPIEKEKEFLENAVEVLRKKSMEEIIQ